MKRLQKRKASETQSTPKRFTRGDARRIEEEKDVDKSDNEDAEIVEETEEELDEENDQQLVVKETKKRKNEIVVEKEFEDKEDKKKLQPVKVKKEKTKTKHYPTCTTRSSPKPLYEAMIGLSNERKKCLKEMGFERFINFPIVELPATLAYHVIDKFHPPSMELRLQKGSIKVTRRKINDMLGVPMGTTKLENLEERFDDDDDFVKEWEERYAHLGRITPPAVAFEISNTTQADFMFKMNFLTLFASTMGTLESAGKVPTTILRHVKENDDISDIDWCSYIMDCLETSKLNWEKVKSGTNYYYGPLTFLCLLYLDTTNYPSFQVMRHRPALRSWNTPTMRKRINMEIKDSCLGMLEHHGEFDPEEEQTGLNLYKGANIYYEPLPPRKPVEREEFYEKIDEKFEIISKEKIELVETIRE